MSDRYGFIVPGRPVPAVRMTRGGKYLREDDVATSRGRAKVRAQAAHLTHRELVGWSAVAAKVKPIRGLVRLSADFWLQPDGRKHPPDLKNLVTLLEDGLKRIAYDDDWRVAEYGCMRRHVVAGCEERTEVLLEGLEGAV